MSRIRDSRCSNSLCSCPRNQPYRLWEQPFDVRDTSWRRSRGRPRVRFGKSDALFLEDEGITVRGNGCSDLGDLRRRLGHEFRKVAVTQKRDDGDKADSDGDEDGVPAGSGGVEGQSADRGTGTSEDGGPKQFAKELFGAPKIGGIRGSNGANFWRGEFGELRRERPGDGRGFPPGLEVVSEVHVEISGLKNRINVAAGDVKDAVAAALGVGPGDVDAIGGEKTGETLGVLNGGDLILAQSESGFFAAVAEAVGTQE